MREQRRVSAMAAIAFSVATFLGGLGLGVPIAHLRYQPEQAPVVIVIPPKVDTKATNEIAFERIIKKVRDKATSAEEAGREIIKIFESARSPVTSEIREKIKHLIDEAIKSGTEELIKQVVQALAELLLTWVNNPASTPTPVA